MIYDNEKKNIEQTWDQIAESFDITRKKPWKQCLDFIDQLDTSSIVADLGCGNGRHLFPLAVKCQCAIGVDISRKFLTIIQKKIQEQQRKNILLLHANLAHLPLKEQSIDAFLYIASLHNIKQRQERLLSLTEAWKILKPTGKGLISVWSRWQEKYRWHFFKQMFFRTGELGDIDISWRQRNLNVLRFYHLYSKKEFERDLLEAGFIIERLSSVRIHSQKSPDNYFAIVKKQ